jgi:uncharacterized protein (TIGR02145 family)
MKKKTKIWFYLASILGVLFMLISGCEKDDNNTEDTFTDYDGNVYHTVTIGTQVWMLENLKVTHYRNGDVILNVTDNTQWSELTTGAYSNYDNNEVNETTYGRLYNWFAISDSRNIAPQGWHLPSVAEWNTLQTYLGGSSLAGGKLKESGTIHWSSPNTGADNGSGFTALPSGNRNADGTYSSLTTYGFWFISEEFSATESKYRGVRFDEATFHESHVDKNFAFAVRCIKD